MTIFRNRCEGSGASHSCWHAVGARGLAAGGQAKAVTGLSQGFALPLVGRKSSIGSKYALAGLGGGFSYARNSIIQLELY